MTADSIALFGGTFNPIHNGHLIIARSIAELLGLSRVVLIPSANPPHRNDDDLADAADRLEMVRLAIAGEPDFEASDFEIRRSGPSYTILTVEGHRESLGPDLPIHWIIGGDTLCELHTWYRVSELVDMCRIVTAARPGFESPDLSPLATALSAPQIQRLRDGILPTPRIDISATDIRRRVRAARSIRYLVPDAVRKYIADRGLYGGGSNRRRA